MFDRFTNLAKRVMSYARQQTQKFNHEYIGTEHVLLGLLQDGGGVAANVLQHMGVDLERIRHEVERVVEAGPTRVALGPGVFTPRTRMVLQLSMAEADQLGHGYIGTEHLLLGLIRESEGIAAQVLRNLGLELDEVREEIVEFLGGYRGTQLEDGSDSSAPPNANS